MKPEAFQPGRARVCAEAVHTVASSRQAGSQRRRVAVCRGTFIRNVAGRIGFWGGQEFGIDEIVALYSLGGYYRYGTREHWAGEGEGVELASLAAGVDAVWKVGEEVAVEGAAGEGGVEDAWVNAGEMRAQAGGDHLAG